MATVQKAISESSSYTTRTLTTTISAPGIRQNAEISVSPSIDASKVSYVINEAAGTITVTLTGVNYTSSDSIMQSFYNSGKQAQADGDGWVSVYCLYGSARYSVYHGRYRTGDTIPDCPPTDTFRVTVYYFDYTVTVTYKTFPEFAAKVNNQKRKSIDGWAKVNNAKRQLVRFWVRVNGQIKEI